VPKADILRCAKRCRYSITSSARTRRWHGDAERLGRFEVNDHFNVGRKLDRQVGGLCAFEYPVDVIRRPVSTPLEVGTVTDQASRLDVLAIAVDRGQWSDRSGICSSALR
jgi:hypothetical protein